jgi:hypothetical protein
MKNMNHRLLFAILLLFVTLGTLTSAFAQITPSQDSYTNTTAPTTNYGTATALGVVSSAKSIETAYIQFDLSSIPAGYTSTNVAKATLKLYVNRVATGGTFNVDLVSGSWSEKTITADLAPSLGTTIASGIAVGSANAHDYVLVDVTSAVGDWLNGSQANDGLALVANSGLSASFDSKENATQSHPAELDIVFTSGGTITGVTTSSSSGLTGGGTSGNLNLSLLNTCSSKQVLQWNGSAWMCAAVGTGTISGVTAGTDLTGGGSSGNITLNLDTTKVPQLNASNVFTGIQTVNNQVSITSSTGSQALSAAGNGSLNGIEGATNWTVGSGVVGINVANTGGGSGVYGASFSPTGYGVSGVGGNGVQGQATVSGGIAGGVFTGYSAPVGSGLGGTPGAVAIGGNSDPNSDVVIPGPGVSATGGNGVRGNDGVDAYGGNGSGQFHRGGNGISGQGGLGPGGGGLGVSGLGGSSPFGDGIGGYFVGGSASTFGDGIDAFSGSGYAGYFSGDVHVTGTLSASVKNFKIDHPLDPANKYLLHASVESSEMMNIYTGNVITDAQAEATVSLPEWFEVLNTDFRYQLTVVGQFAQAIVGREIENHQFQIKTSAPNVKVSWQITGVRQDAYAKAHPLVVEEEKDARLRGFYIHPELYGAPDEKQIEWARHPATMKDMKERRAKAAASTKP